MVLNLCQKALGLIPSSCSSLFHLSPITGCSQEKPVAQVSKSLESSQRRPYPPLKLTRPYQVFQRHPIPDRTSHQPGLPHPKPATHITRTTLVLRNSGSMTVTPLSLTKDSTNLLSCNTDKGCKGGRLNVWHFLGLKKKKKTPLHKTIPVTSPQCPYAQSLDQGTQRLPETTMFPAHVSLHRSLLASLG